MLHHPFPNQVLSNFTDSSITDAIETGELYVLCFATAYCLYFLGVQLRRVVVDSIRHSVLTRRVLHVVVIRPGKQMLDLIASSIVAVVAYEYALWNWAIGIFVSLPVHEYEFTLATTDTSYAKTVGGYSHVPDFAGLNELYHSLVLTRGGGLEQHL